MKTTKAYSRLLQQELELCLFDDRGVLCKASQQIVAEYNRIPGEKDYEQRIINGAARDYSVLRLAVSGGLRSNKL